MFGASRNRFFYFLMFVSVVFMLAVYFGLFSISYAKSAPKPLVKKPVPSALGKTIVKPVKQVASLKDIPKPIDIGAIAPPITKPLVTKGGNPTFIGELWRDVWNIHPKSIIDGGAASGEWTKSMLTIFPEADFLLADPLHEQVGRLQALAKSNPRLHHEQTALGAKPGKVKFFATDATDSSYIRQENDGIIDNRGTFREVPVNSIADLVKKHKMVAPYLIKLDTHGFEIPILEGAESILGQTQLLIIEVYGIRLQPHSPLFWEVCAWLDKRGFQLVDIHEILKRQGDHAFWQADAVFVPKTHFVPEKKTYY
jgi:FkbM family methyltransferase